jgi:hypothetical protein
MLRQIERLLKERGTMLLSDIAIHFEAAPEAVDGMLRTLESKGRVEKVIRLEPCSKGCANCSLCSKDEVSYWRLVGLTSR